MRFIIVPFRLGLIDNTEHTNLKLYDIAVGAIEPLDSPDIEFERTGFYRDLHGIYRANKARYSIDLNYLPQTELGNTLRKQLYNRIKPVKIYLHEPADPAQVLKFTGISAPSSTHIGYHIASNDPDDDWIGATEFTTSEYLSLDDFSTHVVKDTATYKYQYFFFRFKITDFLSTFGIEYIQRISAVLQDLRYDINGIYRGYKVDFRNATQGKWQEVFRSGISSPLANQQIAALRPIAGFSNFEDHKAVEDFVTVRIRNLQERTFGVLTMSINYVCLLINGYGVIWANDDEFRWATSFTGAGYNGKLVLEEI